MRDEQDDRIYQAFRQDLGRDVLVLVKSVGYAFERLTARLYDAPWSVRTRSIKRGCGTGYTVV